MRDEGYDIWNAVDGAIRHVVSGSSVEEVLAASIDECDRRRPHPVWDDLRALPVTDDVARVREWWDDLLHSEPPPEDVNGLWFGLFNPATESGGISAAMYVSGSTEWPQAQWWGDISWWASRRYAP